MSESPEVDVTKIDFPSDGLTIKAIRRRWPESVDARRDDPYRHGIPMPFASPVGELLHNMLVMERDLAKTTFGLEFGMEPEIDYAGDDIKLLSDDLSKLYVEIGIATGQHHADQIIRSIQSQVVAQARQYLPPRS
jgi:hypothetical protein